MMNILAIGLILTSLLTPLVRSPSPPPPRDDDDYREDDVMFSGPRELLCDAFGKCKHKIAKEMNQEIEKRAKEAASGVIGSKDKETVYKYEEIAKNAVNEALIGKDEKSSEKFTGGIGEDIQRNVTGKIEESLENLKKQAKETKENLPKLGQKRSGEILSVVVRLIHILGFSTGYGMCVWVTFVSSYILGRYLPRKQFEMVQRRIYQVYYKAMAYCVFAALLGHLVSQKNEILTSVMGVFQGLSLFSAFLMVLINMVLLEPKETKLMYERMKIEEEGRGGAKDGIADADGATVVRKTVNVMVERQDVLRLTGKLKRLNTYSSALNVSTLVVLTWHMAYMSQRLQGTG